MRRAPDCLKITLLTSPDVRAQLERWAHENLTTMSAEMTRAVRERAAQERRLEKVTN